MTNETTLWDKCLAVYKRVVTEKQMKMWLLPLSVKLENKTLNVFAPNKFILDSVEKNYFPLLKRLLRSLALIKLKKFSCR